MAKYKHVNNFTRYIIKATKKNKYENKKRLSVYDVYDALANSAARNYGVLGRYETRNFTDEGNPLTGDNRDFTCLRINLHSMEGQGYYLTKMGIGPCLAFGGNAYIGSVPVEFIFDWKNTAAENTVLNRIGYDSHAWDNLIHNKVDMSDVYLKAIIVADKIRRTHWCYSDDQAKENFKKFLNEEYSIVFADPKGLFDVKMIDDIVNAAAQFQVTKDAKKKKDKLKVKFEAANFVAKIKNIASEEGLQLKIEGGEKKKSRKFGEYIVLSVTGRFGNAYFPINTGAKTGYQTIADMSTIKEQLKKLNEYFSIQIPPIPASKIFRSYRENKIDND